MRPLPPARTHRPVHPSADVSFQLQLWYFKGSDTPNAAGASDKAGCPHKAIAEPAT